MSLFASLGQSDLFSKDFFAPRCVHEPKRVVCDFPVRNSVEDLRGKNGWLWSVLGAALCGGIRGWEAVGVAHLSFCCMISVVFCLGVEIM